MILLFASFNAEAKRQISKEITLQTSNQYDQLATRIEVYKINIADQTVWAKLYDKDDNLIEDKRVYSFDGSYKNIPISDLLTDEIEYIDGQDPVKEWSTEVLRLWVFKDLPEGSTVDDWEQERKDSLKLKHIKDNSAEVEILKADALESIMVEENDMTQEPTIETKITYKLKDDGEFEEVATKVKIYPKKQVSKKKLKDGVRFDENTGKFYQMKLGSEVSAEAYVTDNPEKWELPKYIDDRLQATEMN